MTASWQSAMRTAPPGAQSASRSSTVVFVAHSTAASPGRGAGAPGAGTNTARASQSRAAGTAMDFCTPLANAGATSDSRVLPPQATHASAKRRR